MSKKALIIIDHGSKVNEANQMLEEIAELIKEKNSTEFEIIAYCHMELAEPTIEQAFEECVSKNYPDVSYIVTDPLGIHNKIIEVILERAKTQN